MYDVQAGKNGRDHTFHSQIEKSSVQILLPACSEVETPLLFIPSSLGKGNHLARISFTCQQVCNANNSEISNNKKVIRNTV